MILSLLFTTLSDPLLGDVLGALQTLARSRGRYLTAHVTRSLPPPAKDALDGSQHPLSTLRLSVSISGLAGAGGAGAAPQRQDFSA